MMGLPTEEEADIYEIINLARKLQRCAKAKGNVSVTVSIGLFVPKAHTPFQWEAQLEEQEAIKRLYILKDNLKSRNLQLKWHDTRMSVMECIFSRGDRSLSEVIVKAWEKGARLDSWGDHFNPHFFYESADDLGINLKKFIKSFDIDAYLPWEHIETGVTKDYLIAERQKAFAEEFTPDCRRGKCQDCGVCDFKTLKPLCFNETQNTEISENNEIKQQNIDNLNEKAENEKADADNKQSSPFYYLIKYTKQAESSLIGHLDLMRIFQRAATRADLPVSYSKGFNPGPLMSFDQAISLGTESLCEQFSIGLNFYILPEKIHEDFNKNLVSGINITSVEFLGEKKKINKWNILEYLIIFSRDNETFVRDKIDDYNKSQGFDLEVKDETGKKLIINSKKIIDCLDIRESSETGCKVWLKILTVPNRSLVKLDELISMLFGITDYEVIITGRYYSENALDLSLV